MDVKRVGQKSERILVIFDGVEDDGDIAIARCHLWMILTKHQQNKVSGPKDDDITMTSSTRVSRDPPVEEPEGGGRLVVGVDVKGQVDVSRDGFRVVDSQHAFQNESGFVLVVQGIAGVIQHVLDTSYVSGDKERERESLQSDRWPSCLPVAVSSIQVHRAIDLHEHLETIGKQFVGQTQLT